MKDFLNKANEILGKGIDSAKKGAKVAGEKIAAFEEETKTRFTIIEKEKEADRLLKELGSKIYRKYLNKEVEEKEIKLICKEIDEVLKEKTKLENEVLSLKDLVVCENCKNTIDINSTFCKYCGYPQEKEEEKKEDKEEKKEVKKEVKKETKKTTTKKTTKKEEKEPKAKKNQTKKVVEKPVKAEKKQPKVATIKLEKKTKEK